MFADLHFHTVCSDGKHPVAWVAERLYHAHKHYGLELAVLTDHDGVYGFGEYESLVRDWTFPICASELSCTYSDPKNSGKSIELHLLMYGIDPHDQEIQTEFRRFKEERENRFFRMCERVREAGHSIDAEGFAKRHQGVLGRPHVADLMVESGIVKDRAEAFDKYLKDGKPFSVPKWRFPLEQALDYARRKKCKTSVAHPGQYGFQKDLLATWKDLGVDAIEIHHPRHTPEMTRAYWLIAKELGFSISGGSDFHTRETDLSAGGEPSLGRTSYKMEDAREFLGELLG